MTKLENTKPIGYDNINCYMDESIVCPYCGYKDEANGEDYGEQDEIIVSECSACGKSFIYKTDYTVRFTTEPYENHYIRTRNSIEKTIKWWQERSSEDEEIIKINLLYWNKILSDLDKEANLLLSEE